MSLVHSKVVVDDSTGEASLEILGDGTEVNGTIVDAIAIHKLSHRDIIVIGGRKLRFEYLPPDYKPIPSQRPIDEEHKGLLAFVAVLVVPFIPLLLIDIFKMF